MTNHMTAAIEAATQTRMEQNECALLMSNLDDGCEVHGDLFVITDYADIYGHLMPTGYCPISRQESEDIIDAALPHLRKMIAQEIRDYWESCGDLIDTHNGARLAFDAIAARIAKGPQQ